ncbi:RNA polymerase sigma factor [Streptomyces avermitilis]|uniref:RNA polymerase sigma factor n=1 Tax=Streptomyces avermitilis TaxID=33903 RepID=UPI0033B94F61
MTLTDQSDEDGCGAGTSGAAEAVPDDARIEAFYLEHVDRVFNFVRRMTESRGVAEDLVSTTFEHFIRAWRKHPDHEEPVALLFQIARRRLNDHYRCTRGRELTVEPGDLEDLAGGTGGDDFAAVERREDLLKALATLKERDRQALLLQHVGELTVAECAEVLGETKHNMKKILERARRALVRAPGIDVYRSAGMAKEVRG